MKYHSNTPTIHTLPTTFPHLPHLSSHLFTSGHPRNTFNSFSPLHHPPHPSRKTYSNCPSFQHATFLVPELQRTSPHPHPFLFYTRAHTSNLPNCPPPLSAQIRVINTAPTNTLHYAILHFIVPPKTTPRPNSLLSKQSPHTHP